MNQRPFGVFFLLYEAADVYFVISPDYGDVLTLGE